MTATAKYMSINSVVGRTQWSEGLKESMINDFVSSGYGNVVPLIGKDEKETSQNIQKNIIGFSSDKNTYLQANNLASIIHKMLQDRVKSPRKYTKSASAKVDYPMGEVLSDCGGWIIYKKTLPDSRVVYNAKIKPETAQNKTDWSAIKGEIYTETGFKWGKFGAFEKWGQIASEAFVVGRLCEILSKYYKSSDVPKTDEKKNTTDKDAEYWANYLMNENYNIWIELKIQSGSELKSDERLQEKYKNMFVGVFSYITAKALPEPIKLEIRDIISSNNEHTLNNALGLAGFYGSNVAASYLQFYKKDPKSWLNPKYYGYPEEEKVIGLYINGNYVYSVSGQADAYERLSEAYTREKLASMISNGQIFHNNAENRIDVIKDSFEYGKKWGVPNKYGNELQFNFLAKGYKVYSAKKSTLVIFKTSMATDGIIIYDNGGEFTLDRYGDNENITSISYVIGDNPISPQTIASVIDDVATDFFERKKQEESPKSEGKSKEDIEKAIKGLQYLADKGNEKAIKAIKGLQYLLNK